MEELKSITIQMLALQTQQEQRLEQQQKFLKLLLNKTSEERTSFTPDAVGNSISEFTYNPDNFSSLL